MHASPDATPPPAGDRLIFGCGHCGTHLEVSVAYAGVQAPCPGCGQLITAPSLPPARAVQESSAMRDYEYSREAAAGILDPDAPDREVSGNFEEEDRRPVPRIPLSRRLADAGIVIGLVGTACVAALVWFFTRKPEPAAALPSLPADLTAKVKANTGELERRREVAVHEARICVQNFLDAPSATSAGEWLMSVGSEPATLPFPAFPGLTTNDLDCTDCRRLTGTERYFTILEGPKGTGPVFFVEETLRGARIHLEAVEQQVNHTVSAFLQEPGSGSGQFYVKWRLCPAARASEFLNQRPDLKNSRLVDVLSAFPEPDQRAFIASVPEGPAAAALASRSAVSGLQLARVRLQWRQHRESGPFVELSEFLPDNGSQVLAGSPGAEIQTE